MDIVHKLRLGPFTRDDADLAIAEIERLRAALVLFGVPPIYRWLWPDGFFGGWTNRGG